MPQISAHLRSLAVAASGVAIVCLCLQGCGWFAAERTALSRVQTISGVEGSIGEPFGIAERKGTVYFSDGQNGKVWRIVASGNAEVFAEGLDTPSGVALTKAGDLIVWDSRLPHGNSKNLSHRPRIAFYLQMFPTYAAYPGIATESWRTGRCIPNWRTRPGYDRVEPWPPAKLSPLGRRLIGLDPWTGAENARRSPA